MNQSLQVNQNRLWQSLMDMARVGALPHGGSCRAALSAEDKAGRELFMGWCRDAGCEVAFDQVGNLYARRPGRDLARPAVATGSHLDTQPHGGKFDGVYGVLAGLEVIRSLNDAGYETEAPLDVVVWTNEEGVRFGPPLGGSLAYAGAVDVAQIHASVTLDGTTVHEDLTTHGFLGEERPGSRRFDSFFEAHIEQGPILEAEGKTIGVVTQVQGIRWLRVTVTGRDSHAGTTPMHLRRDALQGAAQMLPLLTRLVRERDDMGRLTVGRLLVEPNSGATIPGQVIFTCDLRHPDIAVLNDLDRAIERLVRETAAAADLTVAVERPLDIAPVHFADEVISLIRDNAIHLGYPWKLMLSGAGHDAMNVAKVAPTGMIFVPCKDGLSHNEAESATAADLAAGAHMLLHCMLQRAGTRAGSVAARTRW